LLLESLKRTETICVPKGREDVEIPDNATVAIELPNVPGSVVPFPSPGSVSIKYSADTIVPEFGFPTFRNAAEGLPQSLSESLNRT